ncbi:DUF6434 domain-containing protein [Undibacterium sp. TC4M20W]|uniref:DUF6434 domain-containing protein n=1 Tax=Undibacterium sp. TC4M20W TaxID=3413052 RepID=UPI003BF128D4
MKTDWHSLDISRTTVVDKDYKNTQNVRRFLSAECGADFKLDRNFMAWIINGEHKTMGDVADEWQRLYAGSVKPV